MTGNPAPNRGFRITDDTDILRVEGDFLIADYGEPLRADKHKLKLVMRAYPVWITRWEHIYAKLVCLDSAYHDEVNVTWVLTEAAKRAQPGAWENYTTGLRTTRHLDKDLARKHAIEWFSTTFPPGWTLVEDEWFTLTDPKWGEIEDSRPVVLAATGEEPTSEPTS